MVLQSSGEISWSNLAVEYGLSGEVGAGSIRSADKRIPQGTNVSSSNYYGLYQYPVTSNVCYLEGSNNASYPGTGLTWYDISGLSNNFSIPSSGITWSNVGFFTATSHTGMFGPSNTAFNFNNDHTIEFVARERTGGAQNFFVYFESSSASGTNRMINIHLPWNDNRIYYDVRGSTDATNRVSVTEPNPNTAIKHYVFRCRSTTTPQRNIFINGSSIADSGASGTSTAWSWGGRTSLLSLTDGTYPWSGDIYYMRIYNRGLTDSEVTSLYNTMKNKYGI